MVNTDLNSKISSASALNSGQSLYDTPLNKLFEEARKQAQQQYKKTRPEMSASKDEKKPRNTAILSEHGETFNLMSEKIKESLRQKLVQSAENWVNSASNISENSQTTQNSNALNSAQASQTHQSTLNSALQTKDELNLVSNSSENLNLAMKAQQNAQNLASQTKINAQNSATKTLETLFG